MIAKLKIMNTQFTHIMKQPFYLRYILKCLLGSFISYILFLVFPSHQFNWSIVSVLLVLAPDEVDSIKLAKDRIKANLVGATVGLVILGLPIMMLWGLMIGILLTLIICTYINLGGATRSALAALVIVTVQEETFQTGNSPVERMFCVIIGCVIAMVLTVIFAKNEKGNRLDNGLF